MTESDKKNQTIARMTWDETGREWRIESEGETESKILGPVQSALSGAIATGGLESHVIEDRDGREIIDVHHAAGRIWQLAPKTEMNFADRLRPLTTDARFQGARDEGLSLWAEPEDWTDESPNATMRIFAAAETPERCGEIGEDAEAALQEMAEREGWDDSERWMGAE